MTHYISGLSSFALTCTVPACLPACLLFRDVTDVTEMDNLFNPEANQDGFDDFDDKNVLLKFNEDVTVQLF